MKNHKLKLKTSFYFLIAVFTFSLFIFNLVSRNQDTSSDKSPLDSFAICLTEKGITMYGAYWCPHCQNEKAAFGDSFKYVNYVECTQETQKCLEQKVEGYPTWIFADGKRLVGEQGIEKLAKESGCVLPE